MTFGKRLRILRKNRNLTQKDLADRFNVGESTIGMYERDEREPSFEFVKQLADFSTSPLTTYSVAPTIQILQKVKTTRN